MKQIKVLFMLSILITSTNIFAQTWTQQSSPISESIYSCSAVDTNICWICGGSPSVLRTTNGGANWTNVTGEISSYTVGALYSIFGLSSSEAWVGGGDGNLYHTTNAGVNWELATLPYPITTFIDAVHFFNQNTGFVIGDPTNNIWCYYWTTNAGNNWTSAGPSFTGLESGFSNSYAAIDTGHIWFGTNNAKIYKGSLKGGFEVSETPGTDNIFGVAFTNVNKGVAIVNTMWLPDANQISSNGGVTWSAGTFMPYGTQYAIKSIPGFPYIWLGGMVDSNGSIYFSSDNGTSFSIQSILPSMSCVNALTLANVNCGWAGLASGEIYKYRGNLSDIHNITTAIPVIYSLEQNYPNPFNPNTNIKFNLPKEGFVSLIVYDILGKEIRQLVNGYKSTGTYSIDFDASGLSSGIYFYRFVSGKFVGVKKMMIIK
jgi:photosystem II stability/assembly factor-like uncharacterized protein